MQLQPSNTSLKTVFAKHRYYSMEIDLHEASWDWNWPKNSPLFDDKLLILIALKG